MHADGFAHTECAEDEEQRRHDDDAAADAQQTGDEAGKRAGNDQRDGKDRNVRGVEQCGLHEFLTISRSGSRLTRQELRRPRVGSQPEAGQSQAGV